MWIKRIKLVVYGFLILCILCPMAHAQKTETFDVVTYTLPKGWQKTVQPSAVSLGVDGKKGTCLITLFKSIPGSADAKANYKASWDTLVRDTVKVIGKSQIQPTTKENGWVTESGAAAYEIDGKKGLVLLRTMTGNSKVVNLLILTDTDAYQSEIDAFVNSVHLPKIAASAPAPIPSKAETSATPSVPIKSGFKFNNTNFDDGWIAVEKKDWVRVTKGNVAVLVHYPNQKTDAYNSVLKNGLLTAWNILVAPRYADISNFVLKPIQSFESIAFAEADATEKATGKRVYVVLFKKHFYKGNGKYIEFIAPSKSDFEQTFGAYHNNEFGWDKLVNMQGKNRFAVSAGDLTGKWSTSDYASLRYYMWAVADLPGRRRHQPPMNSPFQSPAPTRAIIRGRRAWWEIRSSPGRSTGVTFPPPTGP